MHIQEQSDFHPKIEHVLIPCQEKSYEEKLMELLATFTPYVCLIFANTRTQAASVAGMMRDAGYGIIELHGDLTPRERPKLKRKARRQMIQEDIQRQKKERAKQKVMEKRGGQE